MNQAVDDHHRIGAALQRAQILDDAGQPQMSVNALVARLRTCISAADLAQITDVLATIATSAPETAAISDDRQAGLAEWNQQVAAHALAETTRAVATSRHPTVAEAQRIDSAATSQRTIPGYLAAFSQPASPQSLTTHQSAEGARPQPETAWTNPVAAS